MVALSPGAYCFEEDGKGVVGCGESAEWIVYD